MTTVVAERQSARVYRPHLALRLAIVVAFVAWAFAAIAAAQLPEMTGWSRVVAFFFCGMFTVLGLHYVPLEIEVDDATLCYHGFWRERRVRWDEVVAVDVMPVPFSVTYAVRTRDQVILFNNFISGHKLLADHIVERARLGRR